MIGDIFINPLNGAVIDFLQVQFENFTAQKLCAIVLVYVLGFSILRVISNRFSIREVIGLSALTGLAGITFILFLFLVLIPDQLSFYKVLTVSSLLAFVLLFYSGWKHPFLIKETIFSLKKRIIAMFQINLVFLMALTLILYIGAGLFLKSVYWPVTDWDAVTTFDFFARVIIQEKSIVNSVIQERSVMTGVAYPPMVSFSIAFSYLSGFVSPKFLFPFIYLSMTLTFYCFTKRFVSATGAIVFTLLLLATPELSAFSSFVKTNVVQAAFSSLGIISLFLWVKNRENRYITLSALLLSINAWTRSEGIEFIGVSILILSFYAMKKKLAWQQVVKFTVVSLMPFAIWQFYLGMTPELKAYAAVSINKMPFWDSERIGFILKAIKKHMFHQPFFGFITPLFVIALLANLILARKKVYFHFYFMVLLVLITAHLFLLYQFEYSSKQELIMLLNHSLKRYIFNWLPIASFVIANSLAVKWVFDKVHQQTMWPVNPTTKENS